MNTNLLNAVRRIVAEQGEAILFDPDRLKGFISDYAKDEPKPERLAFGRCIEYGFYDELKKAASEDERARLKAAFARKLHTEQGIEGRLCVGALDLLEALIVDHLARAARPVAHTPPPAPVKSSPRSKKPRAWRKAVIAAAVVIAAIAATGLVSNAEEPPDRLFEKGLEEFNNKNYRQAAAIFTKVIDKEPNYRDAHYYRGISYLSIEDYDNAINDFTIAQRNGSDELNVLFFRSAALFSKGLYSGAARDVQFVVEQAPAFYEGRIMLAKCYYVLADYRGATREFTEAIQINANNTEGYTGRGASYLELKMYDEAFADYSRALEINPADPAANEGIRLAGEGQKADAEKARQFFRDAILDPYGALYNLGVQTFMDAFLGE